MTGVMICLIRFVGAFDKTIFFRIRSLSISRMSSEDIPGLDIDQTLEL